MTLPREAALLGILVVDRDRIDGGSDHPFERTINAEAGAAQRQAAAAPTGSRSENATLLQSPRRGATSRRTISA